MFIQPKHSCIYPDIQPCPKPFPLPQTLPSCSFGSQDQTCLNVWNKGCIIPQDMFKHLFSRGAQMVDKAVHTAQTWSGMCVGSKAVALGQFEEDIKDLSLSELKDTRKYIVDKMSTLDRRIMVANTEPVVREFLGELLEQVDQRIELYQMGDFPLPNEWPPEPLHKFPKHPKQYYV